MGLDRLNSRADAGVGDGTGKERNFFRQADARVANGRACSLAALNIRR